MTGLQLRLTFRKGNGRQDLIRMGDSGKRSRDRPSPLVTRAQLPALRTELPAQSRLEAT
jgi:hypothetical protein